MITYELYNVEGEEPHLQKVITVGEDRYTTNLTYNNTDELDLIDEAVVSQHMDNLAAYTAFLGSQVEVLPDEEAAHSAYPLRNADDVIKYLDITSRWWQYLYYRNEPDPVVLTTGGSVDV